MHPPGRTYLITCPPGHSNIPAISENRDFYNYAVRFLYTLLFEGDDRGSRHCRI